MIMMFYTVANPDAAAYLKEHKIVELFEQLASSIIYEKPSDPKEYIKSYLKQLQGSRNNSDLITPPSLFDETNLISIFGMLDISHSGYIDRVQYLQVMETLGIKKFNENPAGAELNKITRDTFLREAKAGLKVANQTFSDPD